MKKKVSLKKVLIVLFSAYVCYIIGSTQISMTKIRKELNVRQQELTKLQEKNEKLQDEVKMSKTDDYIEKLARERLGMIKDGETPVIPKK
ncbi:septum formation initiator family protein [Clostridium sp. YIM B02515]|uniref:Septum formation initiator family protein n=1 Tax=Clostridium rhizosphaerae TaxID=2803861 RepID=A0ABS1TC24_9CLOT|nr:septum formation initiator family protein [Clostridium rhizosphaerae]MBL4936918.1 septum formation initiator family protein [Clostridium rhizosphaerae]